MPIRTIALRLAIPALAFLVSAALVRFLVRHVESRLQMLAFVAIAMLFEAARGRGAAAPWTVRAALDSAAAIAAIVAVKWSIEGTPW